MSRREAMGWADDQQGWKATRLFIERHPEGNTILSERMANDQMQAWGLGHIPVEYTGSVPGEALATTEHINGRTTRIYVGSRGHNLYTLAHEAAHAVAGAGASHKQAWADAYADLLRQAGRPQQAQAWLDIYGGAGLDSSPWWYATSERLSLGQRFTPPEVGGGYGSSPWGYVRTTQKGALADWEEWTHQTDKWDTGEWQTVDDIPECILYEVRGRGVSKLGNDYDDRLKTIDGQWRAVREVGRFPADRVPSLTYASRTAFLRTDRTQTYRGPRGLVVTMTHVVLDGGVDAVLAEFMGKEVGFLTWKEVQRRDGSVGPTVDHVEVHDPYKRNGIATAMWGFAKGIEPDLIHSTMLLPDGEAWMRSLASALSWRPVGQSPEQWAQEADCLILSDVRSRKMGRRFEVWVFGRLVGNRASLEQAKALAEREVTATATPATVSWSRVLVEPTEVVHYHWGPTTEFSEPLTVYLGDVSLGTTSAKVASYEDLPEGRWTLEWVSTPYHSPSDDFTSITAYARHETEPGIWPVGWLQWEHANDPDAESDIDEVWQNAKGDHNGDYSRVVSLRVHPVARRQGIATALWRAFEQAHNNDPDMWDPGEFTPDGAAFWRGMGKGDPTPTKRMDSRWASLGSYPPTRIKEVVDRIAFLDDQLSEESLLALTRIEEGVAAFDAGADEFVHDRAEAARRTLALTHGDGESETDRAVRRMLAAVADCMKLMVHAGGYDTPMAHRAVQQMQARVESVFGGRLSSKDREGAGVLVLYLNGSGETLFYLTRRSQWVDDYVGYWAPPGGGIEPGEDAYVAAIREFVEETGVDLHDVSLTSLGTFRDLNPDTGLTFTTVVAQSDRTFSGTGSEEITADGWFTLDEMRALELHPGVVRSMDDIRKFIL